MEFSELARDLLTKREGVELSLSPEGRDGGIDILRAGTGINPDLVVQCKRYIKSPKRTLMAHLKAEFEKVKRLNPKRYLIVASQSLTVDNKKELEDHFKPFIASINDILGTEDVNSLLRQHPDVEFRHYKLWLRSSEILRTLLAEGTGVWHSQLKAEIEDNSQVYVQTPAFHKALSILEEHRIVVIAGTAGIGKTTLAQMLAAHYLHSGYQFHEIESLEVEPKHIPRDIPVFIYFDDFLGRSVWRDNANPQTEKRIERLIDLVERDKRLRLVLTTRKYLLESARKFSDVGDRKLITQPQVVLELSDYSRTIRAKILYNHLYFRGARARNCKTLTDITVLNKILAHANFAPRIIEWVSREERTLNSDSTNFAEYILGHLDKPEKLYKSVIQDRISDDARDILFCLVSQRTRQEVTINRLKGVVNSLRYCESSLPLDDRAFLSGLRELDGSLIKIGKAYYHKNEEMVTFLNPGVEDSVKICLWESNLKWLTLVETADFGEDLYSIILCTPNISSNPYDDKSAAVPQAWFKRWLLLAGLHQGSADELLAAFVRCLPLNIWNGDFRLIELFVQKLRERHDEGFDFWPTWSIFGTVRLPNGAVTILNSIEDFCTDFVESVRDELKNIGLFEAGDRFTYLKDFSAFGYSGYEVLEEAAQERCDELLAEVWEESDRLHMEGSCYEEMNKLISLYSLELRYPMFREIVAIQMEREQAQAVRVATPHVPDNEEPDSVLLAMFESLANELD